VEAAKILIFVGFFVLFLVLAKNLFSPETTDRPPDVPSSFPDPLAPGFAAPGVITPDSNSADDGRNQAVLVGADLPFPVSLPPRQSGPDGKYNRPMVLNYYFKKLDLVRGPDDPRSFCDEFFIQFEEPETQAMWTNAYIVATPAGLQQLLDSQGHDSLLFDGMLIVVAKWSLGDLLKIVMDEVMEGYGGPKAPKEESTRKASERYWT
jgi:hypothetical protein